MKSWFSRKMTCPIRARPISGRFFPTGQATGAQRASHRPWPRCFAAGHRRSGPVGCRGRRLECGGDRGPGSPQRATAAEALERARLLNDLRQGEELVAAEVRLALDELGKVSGAVTTDDVLDRIFSRFCIGK